MDNDGLTLENNTCDSKVESQEDTLSQVSQESSDSDSNFPSEDNHLWIFVNNIDSDISKENLKKIFSSFGNVIDVNLKKLRQKRPFAYIKYDHPDYGTHFPLFLEYNAN